MLDWLECKIPPPIITLLFGLLSFGLQRYGSVYEFPFPEVLKLLAVVSVVAGMGCAVLGVIQFKKVKTTVNPHQLNSASVLVTTGIYRFTRNPMYVGLALCLFAGCLWLAELSSFIVLPAFIYTLERLQIIPEERALESKFGENYKIYKKQVKRWL